MKSNLRKNIFTEDLDYSKTTNKSIWGEGDAETLLFLNKLISENRLFGQWLHFAAGDGRYNNIILSQVDRVIATDIDKGALEKLQKTTPQELVSKLKLQVQNITKPFPFKNNVFDGLFNTGTLHLFSYQIIDMIIQESNRVLKPGGIFIFDFATDRKRIKEDGSLVGGSEIDYTKSQAKELLAGLLDKVAFKTQFTACSVAPEKITSGDGTHTFSCNYWLILAEKY